MENKDALNVAKGTRLRLVEQYEKFPPGSVWIAEQPVDLGDLAFITALTAPGQPGVAENHPETLPAVMWALDGTSFVAPTPTPTPTPAAEPEPEKASVPDDMMPWDVEDGEVPDVFRQCAPPTQVASEFFVAYLTVSPPFDDTQLKELLVLAQVPDDQPWDEQDVARMFYAFNELNNRQQDPIIFAVNPALSGVAQAADEAAKKSKSRAAKNKKTKPAEEPSVEAAEASPIPTGVINAERALQGLPPTKDVPAMARANGDEGPLSQFPQTHQMVVTLPPAGLNAASASVEARQLAGAMLQEIASLDTAYAISVMDRAMYIVKAALLA